ncbi:putative receptor protein kinase ZmPK1 [Cynara cardunculus var. scolymus]|uniref:Receptor-like serine/threonine-protein kinase n=1 Tax=Cynara cardunculus var. scolymus TaxID=59895 RepID=A0A103Y5E6_CYNCS|nr:putative receptor protein kinase ZmPK1 [Cynara cardunculus var. scolymus]KVI02858.1 Apple-like protein [Cynara cardunculus var. scolymus]
MNACFQVSKPIKHQMMTKTFILLLFCSLIRPSSSINFLSKGSSLSVDDDSDLITSSDNTFTCGFYGFQLNAYWFAIWFTNSNNRTVVWTANPNRPVSGRGSKVTFHSNGVLVLTDVDGMVLWETNMTSTDADRAVLLNTGNLVLKNQKGQTLWQSFDYPTDTLLPTQTLTKSKRLISASRKGSFQSGYFNLNYDSNNVLTLSYDGPEISSVYWPSRDPNYEVWKYGRSSFNSSRIAVLDDMGVFISSDRLQFNASDMGFGIKRRITIDYDGNLRIYSLNDSTGLWLVTWQAIAQPCNIHGICGRNGICIHGEKTGCSYPPRYEWSNHTDLSQGCKPTFNKKCVNSISFGFVELSHTDYYGFDLNFTRNISLEDCRDICLGDCRCDAYKYKLNGEGFCYAKSALFNGYSNLNVEGAIYLKVPKAMETPISTSILTSSMPTCTDASVVMIGSPSMYESSDTKVKWIYPYSIAFAVGVVEVLLILLGLWVFYGNNVFVANLEDGYRLISSHFRGFSYHELVKATKNFKVEIGRGGSGAVYKGILEDQRVVAVKRLEDVTGGGEFWAEVSTIGHINHMNLVRMWGFCSEKRHRLVVYEYVQNLSLDKRLFSSSFLQWEQRFKVAIGIAKGLAYLHHECLEWVIHCDVKPENILLDAAFEPKIADFGLAKLSERGGQNDEFTRIRGTKGYMAPEWAHNLPITAKVDVYSYGIVVLEMAKGIRLPNVIVQGAEEEESALMGFVRLTKRKILKGKELWIDEIIDPRLEGLFSKKQAIKLVEIGIACVEEDRNKRPTMDSVVQVLIDCESELCYKE